MTVSLQYIYYYEHMYMSNFLHFICNALIWSLTIMHEPAPSLVTSHSVLSEISQLKKIVAWPRMSIYKFNNQILGISYRFTEYRW